MGCAAQKSTKGLSNSQNKTNQLNSEYNVDTQAELLVQTEHIQQDFTLSQFDQKITQRSYIQKGVMKSNAITRIIRHYNCSQLATNEKEQIGKAVQKIMKMNHINVATTIQYYFCQKQLYLVQEYYDGGNLLHALDKLSSKPQIELQEIFLQIVAGLQHLHNNGIVHGDLRMEHIVFENKNYKNIKLIGFGITNTLKTVTTGWKPKQNLQEQYCKSPEAFKNQITIKSDIWACGCLLYFFLSSQMPFIGKDSQTIKLAILRGNVNFESNSWQIIDKKIKDLIKSMLSQNPQNRPTTQEILSASYLRDITKTNSKPNKAVMKNMKDFKAVSEIQAATLQYIADNLMSEADKKKLLDEFAKYDINNDGLLTKEELLLVYKKSIPEKQAQQEIDQLFEKIDTNNSGKIDYKEFLLASIDQRKYFNKEKLRMLFHQIDRDHSGYLSKPELLKIFREMQVPQAKIDQAVKKLDQDGDGRVTEDEFIQMMLSFSQ